MEEYYFTVQIPGVLVLVFLFVLFAVAVFIWGPKDE